MMITRCTHAVIQARPGLGNAWTRYGERFCHCPECGEVLISVDGVWDACQRRDDIQSGMKILLPLGTPIVCDMHPQAQPGAAVRRPQIITVHYKDSYPDTVTWAGRGGYWRTARLTDDVVLA